MKIENIKNLISINPYSLTFYESKNNIIKKVQTPKFSKKNYYISFLNTKSFIVEQIMISKNIPDEDLKDVIEIKAYEELGLDQTKEYKIEFLEIPTFLTEKDRKFHIFVADPKVIEQDFKDVIEKIDYIDLIIPDSLLFGYLYKKDILNDSGVDVFIYFRKNDSVLAVYNQGKYLYSKSIKYSFDEMSERFCELLGERISEDEFARLISQEGLKTSNIEYQQYLMNLFSEIFMYINDILIFTKRSFEIDSIDRVYIGSEFGSIFGADEYAKTFLGLRGLDFSFDYGFESEEPFVDDMHKLLHLAGHYILENDEEIPNFTLFERPLPIWQRPSGRLIAVTAASLLLAFSYPLYNFGYSLILNIEAKKLESEYKKIHPIRVDLENRINQLNKEKNTILSKIDSEKKLFNNRMKILNAVYEKKVNYPMKAKIFAELSKDLIDHKVKTNSIFLEKDIITLNVISNDEKRITNFIKYISVKKSDKYQINTKKIEKDKNLSKYISSIKVTIRWEKLIC